MAGLVQDFFNSSLGRNLAGKAGSAINTVGRTLGNPFPEMNLSESLQSFGGNKLGSFQWVKPAYAAETTDNRTWTDNSQLQDWERTTRPGLYEDPNNKSGMSDLANSGSSGSNGGGSAYPADKYANSSMPEWQRIADWNHIQEQQRKAEEAARQAYAAENSRLNTTYDQTAAQLQNQLGTLGTQRDQSFAQVDLGLGDVQRQVGTSKTNLQTNTQNQIKQAGSTARNVQGANRNQLRALGILNSSAAGQILSKPMNQFDEQRAQLGQFLVQKTAELDDFVNQKVKEATATKDSIVANYNGLVNQIQTDLRFNQRQRNDALQSANAALNQRLAEISQAVMGYQQQAELQKQQFAISLAQAMNYQNPQFNRQALEETRVVTPTQGTQAASFYTNPDEYLRRTLGGLPSR